LEEKDAPVAVAEGIAPGIGDSRNQERSTHRTTVERHNQLAVFCCQSLLLP